MAHYAEHRSLQVTRKAKGDIFFHLVSQEVFSSWTRNLSASETTPSPSGYRSVLTALIGRVVTFDQEQRLLQTSPCGPTGRRETTGSAAPQVPAHIRKTGGVSLLSAIPELTLLTYSTYGLTSDTQMIQSFRITIGSQTLRGEHGVYIAGPPVIIYDQSLDRYVETGRHNGSTWLTATQARSGAHTWCRCWGMGYLTKTKRPQNAAKHDGA